MQASGILQLSAPQQANQRQSLPIGAATRRGVKVRPWTATELKEFARQLETERNLQAGLKNTNDTDAPPELSADR